MRSFHTYSRPDLSYDYGALQPYISGEIMELHHSKHHKAYITNFNASLEKLHEAKDPASIVSLQSALNFNGGGHINHSIFWKHLAPPSEVGAVVQGSGWVRLGRSRKASSLSTHGNESLNGSGSLPSMKKKKIREFFLPRLGLRRMEEMGSSKEIISKRSTTDE